MGEFTKIADTKLTCRVQVAGQPCGYEPKGDTMKQKLVALFTHQEQHVKAMNAK